MGRADWPTTARPPRKDRIPWHVNPSLNPHSRSKLCGQSVQRLKQRRCFTEIMKELKQEVERVERSTDMDSFCIRAFKRAGIENVRPREDVLTYGKWVEQGFKVKQGTVRVKNLRLFHRSRSPKQNRPNTSPGGRPRLRTSCPLSAR